MARAALLAAGAAGLVAGAWLLLRPSPCVEMINRLCAQLGSGCAELRAQAEPVLHRMPGERCARVNAALEAARDTPAEMQAAIFSSVFAEEFQMGGFRDLLHDTLMSLSVIEMHLERGKAVDSEVRALVARGPRACYPVLERLKKPQSAALRGVLHGVLVELHGGLDLGPAEEEWADWCREQLKAALAPQGQR